MPVASVSPGAPLPVAGGPAVADPVTATSPVASRIAGYDFARALAVLGMIVVNYYGIFRTSLKGPLLFTGLAEFLSGRAAVLFVMLAGVGVTLIARRPLLAGTAEAMARFRQRMVARCAVLLAMGLLFRLVWNADILHFYALFLSLGALCVTFSSRKLWALVLVFWLTGLLIYTATLGDPGLPDGLATAGFLIPVVDDLLLGGYYGAFPWFAFLLVGVWFGRPAVMSRPEIHGRIFLVALFLFVGAELLMGWVPTAFPALAGGESSVAALVENNAFPASPLFALSAGACAMMVLVGSMHLARLPLLAPCIRGMASAGQMSLTVYIGHVLLGLAVVPLFHNACGEVAYSYAVTLFMVTVMVGQIFLAQVWCRRFGRGPLELLLRRLSGTG